MQWSSMMQESGTFWAERLRVQWCRHHRVGRLPKIVTSFSTLAQVAPPYWNTSWYLLIVWSIRVDLSICDLWNTISILLTPLLVSPFSQHTFFSSLFLSMLFLMCKFSIVLIFATFSFVYVPTVSINTRRFSCLSIPTPWIDSFIENVLSSCLNHLWWKMLGNL